MLGLVTFQREIVCVEVATQAKSTILRYYLGALVETLTLGTPEALESVVEGGARRR